MEKLKEHLDQALLMTSGVLALGFVSRSAGCASGCPCSGEPLASDALGVRRRLAGLIGAMVRHQERAGEHAGAVAHFLKVTRSYWPGLFHCYDWPDLPRTNNDLEQFFGSYRYHERRATGRKVASPSLVLRGSVRLLAATATRNRLYSARDLAGSDRQRWASIRKQLDTRRERRTERRRFRRSPDEYLHRFEQLLLQSALPT